jgi:RNA polymerase sigma-70 factor (ECF subfamily)
MMRVAHNLCLDTKRRQRTVREHVRVVSATALANMPTAAGSAGDPEQILQLDERQQMLLSALATLSTATQSVMLMHYYQGLTYREIARIMEVGESAIKVRVHRGRQALRQVLAAAGEGLTSSKRETG